jgi:hypothetical protein
MKQKIIFKDSSGQVVNVFHGSTKDLRRLQFNQELEVLRKYKDWKTTEKDDIPILDRWGMIGMTTRRIIFKTREIQSRLAKSGLGYVEAWETKPPACQN